MIKVFLVEDEVVIREGMKKIIPWSEYGYELSGEAGDGELAISLIRQIKPDVVITDIKMPFMDGLTLSKFIRKEFPDTKIVIMSGYDEFEYARQAIYLGVERYILKPIRKKDFIEVLEDIRTKFENENIQKNYYLKFKKEVDRLIEEGEKKEDAIFKVLRRYIKESKKIRFEGDGYSKEWEEEAARRGLSNHKTTPEALKENISEKAINLFESAGVLSKVELLARYEIALEEYVKTVQIESRVLGDIALNHVVPTAVRYQNTLIENVKGLKEIFGDSYQEVAAEQMVLIRHISEHIKLIHSKVEEMIEARKHANNLPDFVQKADAYCKEVKPYFDDIRYHCDKLELMVDDELWTLTKYRELLFN